MTKKQLLERIEEIKVHVEGFCGHAVTDKCNEVTRRLLIEFARDVKGGL